MGYEDLPSCKYCGYRHHDNKAHVSQQDSLGCIREMLKTVISGQIDHDSDYDLLYDICYEAWEHANSGNYEKGSNYWMVMFVDRLRDKGCSIRHKVSDGN